MDPKLLLLETSGRGGFVAVAEGPRLAGVRRLDAARRHARDLAPAVAEMLAAQGWRPRDVQAVVVSRGPGSYTGLRVGIMSAKAFAYATDCALIAVETFAVIAQQAADASDSRGLTPPARLDVIADAQRDLVYVQRFEGARAVTELAIRPAAEWLAGSPGLTHPSPSTLHPPPDRVTGPGLRSLRTPLPEGCRAVPEALWDPQPKGLLQLGLERYTSGVRDDFWTLEPCYLRPSSAEEQWKRG